jgi:organic hydroperoxide reductase OsmC/OhrA
MSTHPTFGRGRATTVAAAAAAAALVALVGTAVSTQAAPTAGPGQLLAAKVAACHITQARSGASTVATTVRFVNHHSGTVGLYWLNYQGNLVFYKSIVRHASFPQVTFRKNAWVVLSSSFNCVGYFVANGARQYVIK